MLIIYKSQFNITNNLKFYNNKLNYLFLIINGAIHLNCCMYFKIIKNFNLILIFKEN